jgi:hypothetical protein
VDDKQQRHERYDEDAVIQRDSTSRHLNTHRQSHLPTFLLSRGDVWPVQSPQEAQVRSLKSLKPQNLI